MLDRLTVDVKEGREFLKKSTKMPLEGVKDTQVCMAGGSKCLKRVESYGGTYSEESEALHSELETLRHAVWTLASEEVVCT